MLIHVDKRMVHAERVPTSMHSILAASRAIHCPRSLIVVVWDKQVPPEPLHAKRADPAAVVRVVPAAGEARGVRVADRRPHGGLSLRPKRQGRLAADGEHRAVGVAEPQREDATLAKELAPCHAKRQELAPLRRPGRVAKDLGAAPRRRVRRRGQEAT